MRFLIVQQGDGSIFIAVHHVVAVYAAEDGEGSVIDCVGGVTYGVDDNLEEILSILQAG